MLWKTVVVFGGGNFAFSGSCLSTKGGLESPMKGAADRVPHKADDGDDRG